MISDEVAEHVRIALYHIERAQHELELACQALSSVRGAANHWSALAKLFGQVQDRWHKLNAADSSKWSMPAT
jgi:hypothetical protein